MKKIYVTYRIEWDDNPVYYQYGPSMPIFVIEKVFDSLIKAIEYLSGRQYYRVDEVTLGKEGNVVTVHCNVW